MAERRAFAGRLPGTKRAFRGAEMALALLVVLCVGLMIVPLPTWTLDLLLASNLSLSVAILLVVVYVPDAIAIATFPSLLLLTTLFRLSLNVASTRLILLQANAGQVIRAFGSFVVRGNYVVGAVVFLILTIIQFVVIAKGAERVGEVGARFTLDAMPGKQMAIDAELRSGAIDGHEARRRRRQLSRESQFYGAMDGAMKFVKGDVIASVIIAVINILGGLAIGVAQKDMEVAAALKRYGLLTIGDGLVSQIPALVLSTAAGLLVTRVASEEADTPLGEELANQLFGVPKALFVASAFIVALAAVPGLPALPFLVIGAGLFFLARARARTKAADAKRAALEAAAPAEGEGFVPMVAPWSIEVSADLAPLLDDGRDEQGKPREGIRSSALRLRDVLFADLGVPLPPPRVHVREALAPRHVLVTMREVPARILPIAGDAADRDVAPHVAAAVLDLLRSRAADFLGVSETQRLLDELEQFAPATVRNAVPKPVTVPLLADVLRRLLAERVSIRDLPAILEALTTQAAATKDPVALTEHVRRELRRAITFGLTGGVPELKVCTIDPLLEDTIQRALTQTPSGTVLALAPMAARDILAAARRALGQAGAGVAVLTTPAVRPYVRRLLEQDFPEVPVVSPHELLPEIRLEPRATMRPSDA